MYVFQHTGQLSIEDFHSPFGGKLDPINRWVLLHMVIPWMSLESHYAPQFNAKTGAPAKPFQMAFGAVYIQQRLGVTDRETVALITESPYLQFFIGLNGYQPLQPFDPSMMVHFRKRIGPDLMKVCNDMTKANGITMIQELLAESQQENGTDQEERKQLAAIEAELGVRPATLEPGSNWGTLILDATCVPDDIPYPVEEDARVFLDRTGITPQAKAPALASPPKPPADGPRTTAGPGSTGRGQLVNHHKSGPAAHQPFALHEQRMVHPPEGSTNLTAHFSVTPTLAGLPSEGRFGPDFPDRGATVQISYSWSALASRASWSVTVAGGLALNLNHRNTRHRPHRMGPTAPVSPVPGPRLAGRFSTEDR